MFALYALVYLFVVLGLGVLISTVSHSQGEAIQLAIMVLLPQVMLSGMIFPLESMAAGVRWLGYLLPLTYFVMGMRGIFLKASSTATLMPPLLLLVVMAVVIFGLAVVRFRRDVHQVRHLGLHAEGQFILRDSGLDLRVGKLVVVERVERLEAVELAYILKPEAVKHLIRIPLVVFEFFVEKKFQMGNLFFNLGFLLIGECGSRGIAGTREEPDARDEI